MKELEKIADSNGELLEIVDAEAREDISEIKQSLSDLIPLEKTASGTIVTFDDGSELPIPSLKVSIEAVQSGSGDPSPTNIRPISGWDEVNVTRCGKNLCKSTIHGYVSSTDNLIVIDNDTESAIFYAHEGQTYTISSSATMNKSRVALVGTDNVVSYTPILQRELLSDNVNTWTATWTGWTVWYKCSSRQTAFDNSAQVELGTTATTYEPYNGHTYTIDLDGTRYGGTLDVVSGVLTVDRASVDLTQGMSGGTISGNYLYYKELNPLPKVISNSEPANVISEGYQKIRFNGVATTVGTIAIRTNNYIYVNTGGQDITPIGKAVYELATPQTIQLTPTQINSLLGTNNIWADTGDLEMIYFVNNSLVQAIYDMINVLNS